MGGWNVPSTVPPLLPPPPGHTTNYDNPDTVVSSVLAVVIVTMTITIVVVVLRMYTKMFILRGYGSEDLVLAIAFVLAIGQQAFDIRATHYGLGYHAWDIPITKYREYTRSFFIAINFHILSVCFSKMSMILFFLRFMPRKIDHILAKINLGVVATYNVGLVLALFFGCKPVATAWNPTIPGGKCVDQTAIYIALISLNVLTDFYVLIAPLPMIFKLRLPVSQKLGLGFLFATGGSIIIITVIWLVKTLRLAQLHEAADFTYYVADITNWAVIETNLGIIVASLPALKPLLMRIFRDARHLGGSSNGTPRHYKATGTMVSHRLKSLGGTRQGVHEAFESDPETGNLVVVATKAMNTAESMQSNDSQEHIINGPPSGIMQQTEVRVEYSENER